ncbi:MAG: GNAT family N-acetyltransferase [Bacteroidia bacterium]|nr:GNAT family N-acetyltransferase [Bacteroidia bacterium]MBT8268899.1 GNAT family N-acetyltransferase [Bacteroidia bacterium]NNF81635.1 GNAT family N-acetyltransferase [Flavobacteriaceae bacterium]NNK68844.1 GNAT family N-acetyltransferase [Flavobacteriaceae bacterium]NNL79394.1 GNAT family N-acetyltransferase [Flavobacteriaceae bacterium]
MASKTISYELIEGVPDALILTACIDLYLQLFDDADPDFFIKRIKAHPDLLIITARDNNDLIGFKIGYAVLNHTFYSWIGGVLPGFRRQGIANQLAKLQEDWAMAHGFRALKTKSMNRFKPMILLNIKRGFDITKVYTNEKGQTKIVFYKSLDQKSLS